MYMYDTKEAIIDWKIIEAGTEVLTKSSNESTVPDFLYNFMIRLAVKIYENAPNRAEAETLMQMALQKAKELHIEN